MVYLEKLEFLKSKVLNNETVQFYYNYIKGIKNEMDVPDNLNIKLLALCGYSNKKFENEIVDKILNQHKIANTSIINTYELLGIYLLNPDNKLILEKIEEKFISADIKLKFVISQIIDKYKIKLLNEINQKEELDYIDEIIKYSIDENFYSIDMGKYTQFIEKANDFECFIILDKFVQKRIVSDINIGNPKDFIINILNNFHNANKCITRDRREKHDNFIVKDEYDVQDLLGVIFKSVYPKIIPEEYVPKTGRCINKGGFYF